MTENDASHSEATRPNRPGDAKQPSRAQPAPAPPAQAPPAAYPPAGWVQRPRRSWGRRLFRGVFVLLFILSVLLNINLAMTVWACTAGGGFQPQVLRDGAHEQTVALLRLEGTVDGKMQEQVRRFHALVRRNRNIRAVVLRVESPGGGVSSSMNIYQAVADIREKLDRPVVVSMGGVAASGGYYVSAAANQIFAEPGTTTGSVGVIALYPIIKGFLEKHGVESMILRSPQAEQWKAKPNPFEATEPEVRQAMREHLQRIHELFEQDVLAYRQSIRPDANTHAPFNGAVYLGKEARALGLVDEVGYLDDACDAAANLANLDNPRLVEYRPRKGFLEQITGMKAQASLLDAQTLRDLGRPRILMLWQPE